VLLILSGTTPNQRPIEEEGEIENKEPCSWLVVFGADLGKTETSQDGWSVVCGAILRDLAHDAK